MTFRVEGNSGDDYNKDLYKKAQDLLKAGGNKKPTSAQIKAEIEKLAKDNESKKDVNDLNVKGLYIEKNSDENTFVNFNDGARVPKIAISSANNEEGALTTMALGEEGGGTMTTMALGEEGGSSIKVDDETAKKIQEAVEQLKNNSGDGVQIDEETLKKLQEFLNKIKNGEIELPKNPTGAGTYGLGENGDAIATTKAMGEEGGGTMTTMALGEEGGSSVKVDDETAKKIQEAVEQLKNNSGDGVQIDEETLKKLQEFLNKIKNGEIELPKNPTGAGTYGLGENGDATLTTMALGEEGGGDAKPKYF